MSARSQESTVLTLVQSGETSGFTHGGISARRSRRSRRRTYTFWASLKAPFLNVPWHRCTWRSQSRIVCMVPLK